MTTTTYPKRTVRKPVGGFVFLTVEQLCLVWWAYRTRHIQLIDLRVWFAAHEMGARRCQLQPDQVPVYTPTELHRLVGGAGGEHLRASLRRLAAMGLLTWSHTQLTFATAPADVRGPHDLTGLHTMAHAIPNSHRRVPVPRQALRLIAGERKASVIATMLGHLLRCLYYREHHCHSGGWCKASWIAEVFGLDLRSVKAARKHLVALDWLQTFHTSQRLCNRWGAYTLINLSWTRATLPSVAADHASASPPFSPPPRTFSPTQLPPPFLRNQEPLQDSLYQQPTLPVDVLPPPAFQHPRFLPSHSVSGVRPLEKTPPKPLPASVPTLRHIVSEDLQDTGRLLAPLRSGPYAWAHWPER